MRQRNICEDRCQTPQILVIWSVENVADPTCGVKLSRETVRCIHPRCATIPPPGLLPRCLHRIIPRASRVFRAAFSVLHIVATLINLLPTWAHTLVLRLLRMKGGRSEIEEIRPRRCFGADSESLLITRPA